MHARLFFCIPAGIVAGCTSTPLPLPVAQVPVSSATAEPTATRVMSATTPPALSFPGIRMEIKSWGHLRIFFIVSSNGDVEFRLVGATTGMYDYDIEIKRFNVGPEGFAKLRAMTEQIASRVAPDGQRECADFTTDMPSGSLIWQFDSSHHQLSLMYGCGSKENRQLLRMADDLADAVRGWADARPVVEVEQVRAPS